MALLSRILGAALMTIGGTFLTMFAIQLAQGGDARHPIAVLAGLVVLFSGVTFGGWRLWRWPVADRAPRLRVQAEPSALDIEQRILAAATRSDGRVTVGEVALECGIPIAKAKDALERMVVVGAAELLVTEGGHTVYRIAGLLDVGEKESAVDPIMADVFPQADRKR